MKKIQAMDEAGRGMAEKRYGAIASKSKYGHSQMGQNLSKKFQMQVGGIPPAPAGMAIPSVGQVQQNINQRIAADRAARQSALSGLINRPTIAPGLGQRAGQGWGASHPLPTGQPVFKRGGRAKKGK